MSEDREKLKQLLLSEEIAEIEALRKLLEDQQQFSQKVSEVLDRATDITIKNNPKFQKKFSKIDSKAYVRAIKANKQTFIDALLPIIGPMIRQSVTNAIRRFVADVNRAMELGFSAKALKWRWQSLTTGVPFAELVFNNTIEYQVQQIFLIDNETGLLIEYAGQEGALLQDKDAMSAMLTAIQDFVKDSIDNESGGLSAAELGDKLLWLIAGNKANLAIVVKGAPTNRLRDTLTDACENIHIEFSDDLVNQETWNNNPELKLQLEQILLTKTQSDDQDSDKTINWWPWLLIIIGLFGWYLWSNYRDQKNQQQLLEQLNQTPGFVLQSLIKDGDQYIATGLKDPSADLSHISNQIQIKSTPFISLEDEMIAARAKEYLAMDGIHIHAENGVVTLSGTKSKPTDSSEKFDNLVLLPGIKSVNNQLTQQQSIEEKLAEFLDNNPTPANLNITAAQNTITVTGQTMSSLSVPFLELLNQHFDQVNTDSLEIFETENLKKQISQSRLPMVNPDRINDEQKLILQTVVQAFNLLMTENQQLKLKILPRSDCQGTIEESNKNINSRGELVLQALLDSGLQPDDVLSEIVYCDQTQNEVNPDLLGVWFEVKE